MLRTEVQQHAHEAHAVDGLSRDGFLLPELLGGGWRWCFGVLASGMVGERWYGLTSAEHCEKCKSVIDSGEGWRLREVNSRLDL